MLAHKAAPGFGWAPSESGPMLPIVRVPVLKPLDHEGRSYVRGDMISVSVVDAVDLTKRGFVTLTVGATPKPDPVLADEPRQKRKYQRRDVTASEGVTYERRDLTADADE